MEIIWYCHFLYTSIPLWSSTGWSNIVIPDIIGLTQVLVFKFHGTIWIHLNHNPVTTRYGFTPDRTVEMYPKIRLPRYGYHPL